MKKLSFLALLCCCIWAMQAQTNTRFLGTTFDDEFKSIIQAANGDWILGGTRTVGADKQYVLTRTNPAGTTVLWTHTYGNVNQADNLMEVLEEPNNNLVFLGESAGAVELFRVSSTGAVVGTPVQIPSSTGVLSPQDFIRMTNGDFAVGGIYHTGTSTSFDCLLMRVANNFGSIVWERRYTVANADWINGMMQAANGDIVAVGSRNDGTFHDGTFLRVSAAGALVRYNSYPRTRNEAFYSLVERPNGDFIMLGEGKNNNGADSTNYNSTNMKLMSVNSMGGYLWEVNYANNAVLTGEHPRNIGLNANEVVVSGITNLLSIGAGSNGRIGGRSVFLAGISLDGLTVNWSKLNDINASPTTNIQLSKLVVTANAATIGISTNNRFFAGESNLNRNFLLAENTLNANVSGCLDENFALVPTAANAITRDSIAPTVNSLSVLGESPVYVDSIITGSTNTGCFCTNPTVAITGSTGLAGCNNTLTVSIANTTFPVTIAVTGSNGGNTFNITANASPFTITGLCPGSYSMNFTTQGGCNTIITHAVENVCQGFNVSITGINLAFPACNSSTDILISGGASSLPATVQTNWSNNGAAAYTVNANAHTIMGECPETYNTIITNALGCKDTIYYTIPNCVDSAICVGSSIILSAWDDKFHTPFTTGNQITGNWLTNGVASGTGATLTISPTANTNYIFNGQLNNVVNGVSTFVQFVNFCVNVNLTTPPTLTATASPATICAGQTSTLSVTGGGMNAMYRWYRMPGTNLGTGMTKVVSPSTTTTYYAIVDCVPCTDTVWVTVNVVQPTSATITGPAAICGTQAVSLTATGGGTYSWKLLPFASIVGTAATLNVASVNTTRTYTVTATNAPCPTTTASHTITVNPIPSLTLPLPTGCKIVGQPLTFNATSTSNIATWNWGNNPNVPTGITSTANNSAATYTMVAGTNANIVSLSITDVNNCTRTATVSVSPNNLVATIAQPTQSGACNSRQFTVSLSGLTSAAGTVVSYNWVFKNITQNTQVTQTTTTNTATQLFAAPGIDVYEVCVTITTSLGCTTSVCMTPNLPACSCNIAANFCTTAGTPATAGTAIPVIFNNTSTGGGATGLQYVWNWGDGTANNTSTSTAAITHNFASTLTSSNVELTVTGTANGMQCCQKVNIPVSIPKPCPITSTNVTGFNYRQNSTGSITFYSNVAAPTGCVYAWNFGNSITSTAASPTYTYPVAGTYTACLTITHTATGCSKTFCQTIIAASAPNCNLIPRYTATRCTGAAMDITFNVVNNTAGTAPTNVTYSWTFGDGTSDVSTSPSISHTFPSTGNYTVCLQKVTANCTTNVCHTFNVQMPTYTNCSPAPTGLKTTQGDDKGNTEELVPLEGNNWLLNKVEIVPNPAQNITNLHFALANDAEVRMEAYTMEGKGVWEKTSTLPAGQQKEEINLSGWAAGMYIIRVTTGEEVQNIKLVVEN